MIEIKYNMIYILTLLIYIDFHTNYVVLYHVKVNFLFQQYEFSTVLKQIPINLHFVLKVEQ